jgi:hypothetical protein
VAGEMVGADFYRLPDERCTYLGLSDRIRHRHAIDTAAHPRIRLIYFAYCKVGERWDIIRRIWNFKKFMTPYLARLNPQNITDNSLPNSCSLQNREISATPELLAYNRKKGGEFK